MTGLTINRVLWRRISWNASLKRDGWHLLPAMPSLGVGKAAAGLGMNKFAKDAPVHILVVEESANITSRLGGKLKGKHFPLIDIGIVAAHMVLAAESEGLGSCILGWFDEKEIKSLTGIPSSKRVLLDILIGYPVKEKRKKIRKESGKIISYNSY